MSSLVFSASDTDILGKEFQDRQSSVHIRLSGYKCSYSTTDLSDTLGS